MPIPKVIQIYKNKQLSGDSGTDTFVLPKNDQVLEYLLQVRSKNGSTANAPDAVKMLTVENAISKIEVKSGGTIFKSYNAEQCRKISTYRNGCLPPTMYTQDAGTTYAGNDDPELGWQVYDMPINFNLKQDPYGNKTNVLLPAPVYDSLEMVLDFDFTISSTAGFVTSEHYMDLYAMVMPRQSESEMLQKKILVEANKRDYTSLAAGDQGFDLTVDSNRMLRQLFVMCYEAGIGEGVDITSGIFQVNGDPKWTWKWGNLQHKNALDCNLDFYIDYYMKNVGTTDELWTQIPSPLPQITAGTSPTAAPHFSTLATGDKVTVTTDSGNDINLMRIGSNVLPAAVVLDFDQDGLMRNLQPQGVNSLEMYLTNGGAGGAVKILEQSIANVWGR